MQSYVESYPTSIKAHNKRYTLGSTPAKTFVRATIWAKIFSIRRAIPGYVLDLSPTWNISLHRSTVYFPTYDQHTHLGPQYFCDVRITKGQSNHQATILTIVTKVCAATTFQGDTGGYLFALFCCNAIISALL